MKNSLKPFLFTLAGLISIANAQQNPNPYINPPSYPSPAQAAPAPTQTQPVPNAPNIAPQQQQIQQNIQQLQQMQQQIQQNIQQSIQSMIPSGPAVAAPQPGANTPINPATLCKGAPTCEIYVAPGAEFLQYLAICPKLGGAVIKVHASQLVDLAINANNQVSCNLTVTANTVNNPTVTCNITPDQIAMMTSQQNITQVQQFQQAGNIQMLSQVLKPIFDCINTLPPSVIQGSVPAAATPTP